MDTLQLTKILNNIPVKGQVVVLKIFYLTRNHWMKKPTSLIQTTQQIQENTG